MNTTSHEQAIARLMGVDLWVWSSYPRFGDGDGYGDGYSGCGYGDGIGCGYGDGIGCGYGDGHGIGNGDGNGSSRES
jgi:hypothetical protein